MTFRERVIRASDRGTAVLLAVLLLGSVLAFGGAVWWFRPFMILLSFGSAALQATKFLLLGRMPILKSPLAFSWLAVLALAASQLVALPPTLARWVSPASHAIYSTGVVSELVERDDPGVELPQPANARSPVSLDRSATLRWLVGAAACLAIFWSVSHFTDRLNRLYLVIGCLIAAFLMNGALGIVQASCGATGLMGFIQPGQAPAWGPTWDDLLDSPGVGVARPVAAALRSGELKRPIVIVPDRPAALGTMMGGSGAFLALASLALPLAMAVLLTLIAPGGSRESLTLRLRQSGQGSLVILMVLLLAPSAFLVGMAAGPRFAWPFLASLAVVGLPAALVPGSRASALGFSSGLAIIIVLGAALAVAWPALLGGPPPIEPLSWPSHRMIWTDAAQVLSRFPMVGMGLGGFSTIHPYFKSHDDMTTTALSSLLQFTLESGLAGLGVLVCACLWCLWRLPGAVGRVGSADWTLAQGLIGAAIGFTLWSTVHWAAELPAVAISASALGGAWNRFLAGGVDLFVDRG